MKKENQEFEKPKLLEVEDLTLKLIEANKKIKKEEKERLKNRKHQQFEELLLLHIIGSAALRAERHVAQPMQ